MKRIPILLTIALNLTAQIPALQVDPNLVYVRVAAIEPTRNRPIRGLSKEQFKVSEDSVPQDIVYFSEDTLPLRMGVLTDVSETSKDETARAVSSMTKTGAKGDEFVLLEAGKTPLHESILKALDALALRGDQGKLALLVVTSKKEPAAYPLAMVRERLKALDIQFYVALHTGSDVSSDSDRQVIRELAERTGGNAYFPSSLLEQAEIFKRIVRQLKSQYVIGYRASNRAMDGKWRKVKITGEFLEPETGKIKKMNILTKPGYYAPTAPR